MITAKGPKEFIVHWFCKSCWQEGTYTFPGEVPPVGWPDPAAIPGVQKQHARILRGFIKPGKCVPDIRLQESKSMMKRVRRMRPPLLPDDDNPIIITKRGTK